MYRVLNSHCEVHVSIDDRVLARFVKNKAIKLSYGIAYRTDMIYNLWVGKT